MKTKLTFLFAIFLLNFFTVTTLRASHLAGGEVTYTWLGGNTYRIVCTLYRDCMGIAAPTTLQVILSSATCGQIINLPAAQVAGTGNNITLPCPGQLTTCNGGTIVGIQKWQYYLDYTLPQHCADWTFSFTLNARNAAVTTIQNPSSHNMYVEAHLNDTAYEHDSPVFVGDPNWFYCIGLASPIDNSAMDAYDSLGYSLIHVRGNSATDTLSYNAGYNTYNWVSSSPLVSLDSTTGTITIHPTATEVAVYAIQVNQYRNGALIGSIMRDIQIYTQACGVINHFPQISGIDSTFLFSTVFPFNKQSCFNIYSTDSDTAQTTRFTLRDSILGATFTEDTTFKNSSAQFCWIPSITYTGYSHCFSVQVHDNNCPSEGGRTFMFCITVVDSGYAPKTIHGTCFLDVNNNGIQDTGEPGYDKLMVNSSGGSFSYGTQPSPQGFFLNYADSGTITTTIQNLRPYFTYSPSSHTTIFTYAPGADSVNFAIVPIPGVQDLRITLYPFSNARPGHSLAYQITYSNLGTDTMSGTILFVKDSYLSVDSAVPTYATISGDSVGWSYSNLLPNETRYINIYMQVSSSATFGTILISDAVIEPIATDTTPSDNVFQFLQTVRASLDPNEKSMLGGDYISTSQVATGQYLTYFIGFQNTGTDTAFRVIILDTLDNKLDGSTFEMISASHPYTVGIKNQKDIEWAFNNILLPDSGTNEPASHGFVCYRIKPKSTVAGGDQIKNTADIIFDYNQPVATNTAVTTVTFPTTISNIGHVASNVQLFPNPSGGAVTLSYSLTKATGVKIEIYDSFGRKLNEINNIYQSAGKQEITFDTKMLAEGIYFLKINIDGNIAVMKMVRM